MIWSFKEGKFSVLASAPHDIQKGWDWSAMNIDDVDDDYDDSVYYLPLEDHRAFRSAVEDNPKISLKELYKEVARETTGSHAGVYNYWSYGSLSKSTFEEYTIASR